MAQDSQYYMVFYPSKKEAMHKKVEHSFFKAYAQDQVLTEIIIAGLTYEITNRRTFNVQNSFMLAYFLIVDIKLKA